MIKLDSYKSKWIIDEYGNYTRIQKKIYLFEIFSFLLKPLSFIKKVKILSEIIGKKKQGVDFYENYSSIIKNFFQNDIRLGYETEFQDVMNHIDLIGINEFKNKKILDVSGEPGFFAYDLSKENEVILTSFNHNVTKTSSEHYKSLSCITYDFNSGKKLSELMNTFGKIDFVFLRYCIGFCLKIDSLFNELSEITKKGSILYITYSRPSRGVVARWMFDDYVYLKLYDIQYLIKEAHKQGFKLICSEEFSKYIWNKGHNFIYSIISKIYTREIFRNVDNSEKFQYNNLLIFKKL